MSTRCNMVWEIDVEAKSPEDAALFAESVMHDYAVDGHRPVFDVFEPKEVLCRVLGEKIQVDLETED